MAVVPYKIMLDSELKNKAGELFESMGMDMSTAVNLFLESCVRCGGLPFDEDAEEESSVPQAERKEESGSTPAAATPAEPDTADLEDALSELALDGSPASLFICGRGELIHRRLCDFAAAHSDIKQAHYDAVSFYRTFCTAVAGNRLNPFIAETKENKLFIIEELDRVQIAGGMDSILYNIINTIYDHGGAVIISSSLLPTDIHGINSHTVNIIISGDAVDMR